MNVIYKLAANLSRLYIMSLLAVLQAADDWRFMSYGIAEMSDTLMECYATASTWHWTLDNPTGQDYWRTRQVSTHAVECVSKFKSIFSILYLCYDIRTVASNHLLCPSRVTKGDVTFVIRCRVVANDWVDCEYMAIYLLLIVRNLYYIWLLSS